ncbi:hypothetical protein [Luteipulveratus mongoliensis]|uniref:PH domain-containing protein n=1 Tax=Luteipulveratus mongoliensis TaxID=571913 RepID=A0A0K1JK29_9MICO|nr:hypothetical protein [Luteipulveratus mongoliensis]AKU17061.1 hypothetical protein VV02_16300 [Luteipulveratus mongoliensis]
MEHVRIGATPYDVSGAFLAALLVGLLPAVVTGALSHSLLSSAAVYLILVVLTTGLLTRRIVTTLDAQGVTRRAVRGTTHLPWTEVGSAAFVAGNDTPGGEGGEPERWLVVRDRRRDREVRIMPLVSLAGVEGASTSLGLRTRRQLIMAVRELDRRGYDVECDSLLERSAYLRILHLARTQD